MKVFQFAKQVPLHTRRFEAKHEAILDRLSYFELLELYVKDGFYSTHLLKPILNSDWDTMRYVVWDYERLQKKWAVEHNFVYKEIKDVLWAQMEEFQPDVIYNFQPIYFTVEEIENLPVQCKKVCWFAAPVNEALDFSAYDVRLTNVPLDLLPQSGDKHLNKYFYPAITEHMEEIADNQDRPIDVLFYGQYMSKFFVKRNALMDRLMEYKTKTKHDVRLHLLCSIVKKPLVNIPYVRRYLQKIVFPPKIILNNRNEPLFGAELYETIAQSKIVVNASVDFTGEYKVNMRNFETTGCGAMLLTDKGIYPDGFEEGRHYVAYSDYEELIEKIEYYLNNEAARQKIANKGRAMVRELYSKDQQWEDFLKICAEIE